MKIYRLMLLAGIMLFFAVTVFAVGLDRENDDKLVLWLDFDTDEPVDLSPNKTAFLSFVSGTIVEGIIENAWQFEEGTQISLGQALSEPFAESTFSVWVRLSSVSGVLYEEGGGTNGFCVQLLNGMLQFCTRDGGAMTCLETEFPVNDEEWHLITAVFSGAMELYVDGELMGEQKGVAGIGSHANESGIGKIGEGTSGTACSPDGGQWTGIMDELAVTRRALTQQEVVEEFKTAGNISVEAAGKLATMWGNIKIIHSQEGR